MPSPPADCKGFWPTRVFRYSLVKTGLSAYDKSVWEHKLSESDTSIPSKTPTFRKPGKQGRLNKGPFITFITAVVILLLNLILLCIFLARRRDGSTFVEIIVYDGSCSTTDKLIIGLHLLINVLSSGMLAASNYCMQYLNAPTRSAVDDAHSRGKWLSVGVASLRNIPYMGFKKIAICVVLFVTSVPIHLFYNAVVFQSTSSTYSYSVMVGGTDFSPDLFKKNNSLADCAKSITGGEELSTANFEKLTTDDCEKAYSGNILKSQGSVVVLSKGVDETNHTLLFKGTSQFGQDRGMLDGKNLLMRSGGSIYNARPALDQNITVDSPSTGRVALVQSEWQLVSASYCGFDQPEDLCYDLNFLASVLIYRPDDLDSALKDYSWQDKNFGKSYKLRNEGNEVCTADFVAASNGQSSNAQGLGPFAIDGCYAAKQEEHCRVNFNTPVMLTVIICGVLKSLCTLYTALSSTDGVLLTTGDAIASFLTSPDPTTEGSCMLSKARHQTNYIGKRRRWMSAPSLLRWLCCMVITLGFLIAAGVLLYKAMWEYKNEYLDLNINNAFHQGFGSVMFGSLIQSESMRLGATNSLLLANTPQLCISISYFCFNNMMTVMTSAAEYSSYGVRRKYLRVTNRLGQQRATYWLSMPYQYGFTLLAVFSVLHWTVSQSLFYVHLVPYSGNLPLWEHSITTCGYSCLAILISILVGGLIYVSIPLLGLRRLKSAMPLAGNCSRVISATCHPPPTDVDAALKAVQWGEVITDSSLLNNPDIDTASEEFKSLHCSFTSYEVLEPKPGKEYT